MFSKLKKLFKGAPLPTQKLEPEKMVLDKDSTASSLISKASHQKKEKLIEKTVEKSPSKKTLKELKRNRKGIRVIDKHMDVNDLFSVEDNINHDAAPVLQPASLPGEKTEQKNVKSRSFKSVTRTTRNGFPILDDLDDFSLFMEMKTDCIKRNDDKYKTSDDATHNTKSKRQDLKNKHGIPMLPDRESLNSEDSGIEIEKNEFMRLLNDSLGGKTRDVLMNEKGVRTVRKRPLSLKEKVKRYPLPQSQLDLHGYTAIKAELRAETFIKNAYGNQIHTVIIIVGKGLHSNEGAVLPGVIEALIISLRKDGIVLFYEWENEKKVQSGSVSVYLNNMVFD